MDKNSAELEAAIRWLMTFVDHGSTGERRYAQALLEKLPRQPIGRHWPASLDA